MRIRGYLMGALGLIERTALFSDAVDWQAVRLEAEAALEQARSYAGTHALLASVLAQAGGRHSSLRTPECRGEIQVRTAAALGPAVPSGQVAGGVAYLKLPWLPGSRRLARRYAATGGRVLAAMATQRPAGWIVDLRDNAGGNLWPMLAAAAGLLDDGILGYFVLAGGQSQAWSLDHGRILLDGRRLARSRSPFLRAGHLPVAVLTSGRTASAGEAVALALRGQPRVRLIGAPTAGFTTGNRTHILRDGTRLTITGSSYAGRDRRPVTGPVPIDQHISGTGPNAPLAAALSWLRGQDHSRRGDSGLRSGQA